MARFTFLDYGIFVVYLLASVLIGVLFVREQRDLKDYFLAGQSMNSIVVAISVLAALFSGITYLGAPAEVYAHSFWFVLIALSFFIATPVTNLVFLPFFYNSRFFTAYEFLEVRFSVGIRTMASVLFISRTTIWLSLATYAPALALELVTGIPLWLTITTTGLLTTFYTTLGGMKAVIWTDVMQFVVLFGGQIAIIIAALAVVPGGAWGVHEIAQAGNKYALSFSLDPTIRVTLWGLIIGGAFANLVQMATDQVSVQRYLTARDIKTAQRSLWLKLALTLPVVGVFYVTGLVLYAFYQTKGDPVASKAVASVDQILPYFVVTELPIGMPGLLVAAIYAASMSTISAGLNSMTSCTLVDIYQRLYKPKAQEEHQLNLARWITAGFGLLVTALAFFVSKLGTLLQASNTIFGFVGGPLLGLFLLGMLSKKANAQGAFIGWLAGLVALLPTVYLTKVSFLWYGLIGCLVTWSFGLFFSRIFASRSRLPATGPSKVTSAS